MLKGLTKDDTTITPYVATKDWQLSNVANTDVVLAENGNTVAVESVQYTFIEAIPISNCNVAVEQQSLDLARFREGLKTSGLFYPDIEPKNADGTYKRLVHTQISTMFYNHFRDPTQIWGAERIDFDTSRTKKFLSNLIKLLDIPTNIFGDKILEGSVQVIDNTLDNTVIIMDDGNSNLFAGPNLFSKQQELGNHPNIFVVGNNSGCDLYFTFNPPNAPNNLTINSGSAILTWNDTSNNEDGFVAERSIDNGLTYTFLQSVSANITGTIDNTVATPGTYYYRIYSFNGFGSSSFSNTASITFIPIPIAPTNLTASSLVDTSSITFSYSASLVWTDNSLNEDGFVIQRSTGSGSIFINVITASANATSSFDTTVSAGTTYLYRVFSFNSSGNSSFSNTASVTISDNILNDTMESYSNNVVLNGLNGGHPGNHIYFITWSNAYVDKATTFGVQSYDSIEFYSSGSALNGLNGIYGFTNAYTDRTSPFRVFASDDMESYVSGSALNGLNSGSGFTRAYSDRIVTG